jgi:hypothetical protein
LLRLLNLVLGYGHCGGDGIDLSLQLGGSLVGWSGRCGCLSERWDGCGAGQQTNEAAILRNRFRDKAYNMARDVHTATFRSLSAEAARNALP